MDETRPKYPYSPTEDDWTAIEDAAARKRIQNRLAQRAHRKKYGRKDVKRKGAGSSKSRDIIKSAPAIRSSITEKVGVTERCKVSTREVSAEKVIEIDDSLLLQDTWITSQDWTLVQSHFEALLPKPSPSTDTYFLTIHSMSTINAMLANANLLRVPCNRSLEVAIHVHIPPLSLPPSLIPTSLQASVPHYPYLDFLPIPALRDKLVKAHAIIDIREMWRDLSVGDVKVWGATPWEGAGWEIARGFAQKWWWLMDEDVLRSTNFWRATRGEAVLSLEELKAGFRDGE